jgi:hypothetical protein
LVLPDVNVLVYAHRQDALRHQEYLNWLNQVLNSDEAFGISDRTERLPKSGDHPRVFRNPTPLSLAQKFVVAIHDHPGAVTVSPGERHWDIFWRLCQEVNEKGKLIADAYLAALAIEAGAEWITTDRDFARFPLLRWKHPLA